VSLATHFRRCSRNATRWCNTIRRETGAATFDQLTTPTGDPGARALALVDAYRLKT
jgi:hypothetical protein